MPASRDHRVSSSPLQNTRLWLHAQNTAQRLLNEGFGWMYDPFVTGICARKRHMGALEAQQLSWSRFLASSLFGIQRQPWCAV